MTLKNECSQWVFECFEDWKKNPSRNHVYDKVTAEWLIDMIFARIEGRIDSVNKIKPANVPEDVIYNCGYVDGIGKVKEILSK